MPRPTDAIADSMDFEAASTTNSSSGSSPRLQPMAVIPSLSHNSKQEAYARLTHQHTSKDSIYSDSSSVSMSECGGDGDGELQQQSVKGLGLERKSIDQLNSLFVQIQEFGDSEDVVMLQNREDSKSSVPRLIPSSTPTTNLSLHEDAAAATATTTTSPTTTPVLLSSQIKRDPREGSKPCKRLSQLEIKELYSNSAKLPFVSYKSKEKLVPLVHKRHTEEIARDEGKVLDAVDDVESQHSRKAVKEDEYTSADYSIASPDSVVAAATSVSGMPVERNGKSLKTSFSNIFRPKSASSSDLLMAAAGSLMDVSAEEEASVAETKTRSGRNSLFKSKTFSWGKSK
ncbi:UNVERIFIED_CONTAM: hypothetical protein HDU68_007615 [Siphonaria sp. JEL0065]|nr:hypothetical protein HDU68_007615 [Siphonaria sp. JEL0065]